MPDLADDADRAIEQVLARGRAAAAAAGPVFAPCGHCLNCGATALPDGSPWPPAARWCDADCKEDWSRATRVR